ncbi:MAG: ketoacyl-ACP synthase III [Firmicutes bacterium]|nr:ketoacyl-ACP synthase III [Bacillota bacterium]
MSFSIIGTGSKAPSQVKTNDDLARIMDTSDEWIRSKTGIRERRILGEETITDLVVESSLLALEDAGVQPKELDLIICATVTPDYITPSMGCVLQRRIGAVCPAFDISAACAGFLYAWDIADGYFARKLDSKILVVGAEAVSKLVDWRDRTTAVIFGDGAGAVVLGRGNGLKAIRLNNRGDETALFARYQKGNCPIRRSQNGETAGHTTTPEADADTFLHMEGQKVFQFAVSSMCRDLKNIAKQAGMELEDVDYVLPHQANQRIIDYAISRLPLAPEKYLGNIAYRGNTSAAAIPVLLDEFRRKGQFRKGDILAFTSFGAGLTSAAAILEWDKEE